MIHNGAFAEISSNLKRIGVKCGVFDDGLVIEGTKELNGADFGPFRNPEVALAFYLAALAGHGKSHMAQFETVEDYFQSFVDVIEGAAGQNSAAAANSE